MLDKETIIEILSKAVATKDIDIATGEPVKSDWISRHSYLAKFEVENLANAIIALSEQK